MNQIASRLPDSPDLWDRAAYIADEAYCRECSYLLSVHDVSDDGCPSETVARQRWGDDR